MFDFLKSCIRYFTGGTPPQQPLPKARLWSANERTIDFCVTNPDGEEVLTPVPRNYIRYSSFAQQYAPLGTVVVDIRPRPEKAKNFLSHFPEFDIELNTGAVYSIGPSLGPVPNHQNL